MNLIGTTNPCLKTLFKQIGNDSDQSTQFCFFFRIKQNGLLNFSEWGGDISVARIMLFHIEQERWSAAIVTE